MLSDKSSLNGEREALPIRFVVFSDDWGVHPSSCQHIFKHIIGRCPVVWVNTIGMRNPRLTVSDLKKSVDKVGRMFSGDRKHHAGRPPNRPAVIQPFMLPGMSRSWIRRLNAWLVSRALRKAVKDGPAWRTVVVTTVPNSADYVRLLAVDRVVYYCVDDFSEWPGLDKDLILGLESDLVRNADAIVATSPALKSRLEKSGKPTSLLEHGVDVEHFSKSSGSELDLLQDIRRPRIGFFGLIDGRLDQVTLGTLAETMPGAQFVLAGPSEVSTTEITRFDNVHLVGPVPYANLPDFVAGMDALIIPYKVDALADALSPLKLKEYLATGVPVVSSPIAASKHYCQYLRLADGPTAWREQLHQVVTGNADRRRRPPPDWLVQESWQSKAEQLTAICKR